MQSLPVFYLPLCGKSLIGQWLQGTVPWVSCTQWWGKRLPGVVACILDKQNEKRRQMYLINCIIKIYKTCKFCHTDFISCQFTELALCLDTTWRGKEFFHARKKNRSRQIWQVWDTTLQYDPETKIGQGFYEKQGIVSIDNPCVALLCNFSVWPYGWSFDCIQELHPCERLPFQFLGWVEAFQGFFQGLLFLKDFPEYR